MTMSVVFTPYTDYVECEMTMPNPLNGEMLTGTMQLTLFNGQNLSQGPTIEIEGDIYFTSSSFNIDYIAIDKNTHNCYLDYYDEDKDINGLDEHFNYYKSSLNPYNYTEITILNRKAIKFTMSSYGYSTSYILIPKNNSNNIIVVENTEGYNSAESNEYIYFDKNGMEYVEVENNAVYFISNDGSYDYFIYDKANSCVYMFTASVLPNNAYNYFLSNKSSMTPIYVEEQAQGLKKYLEQPNPEVNGNIIIKYSIIPNEDSISVSRTEFDQSNYTSSSETRFYNLYK